MIIRIWRTGVDESRAVEYECFALEESMPMFRGHRGFLGLLFGRNRGQCVVTTLWQDHAAADALEESERYRDTVARISAAGFLVGESTVERFEVHGSYLPHTSTMAAVCGLPQEIPAEIG